MNILITGGAGFVGTNLAERMLNKDHTVIVIDNLYRQGSEKNLQWLKQKYPQLIYINHDIRQPIPEIKTDFIFHTAAQVAVTTSVQNPKEDFEINALGTLHVLELARRNDCGLVFCSTNKVYGDLANIPVIEQATRYEYTSLQGISEEQPLDPHTPYGVSKAAADCYVRDYARVYGLPNSVFRMSCIYGSKQHGIVDQGWIDFILRKILNNETVSIFGDGKQVRDILHVSDLVNAFELAITKPIDVVNIGGGLSNTISILELLEQTKSFGLNPRHQFENWRPSDQKAFYCDISKAQRWGWNPIVSKEEGLRRQLEWIKTCK
jgi:CDP-paratose 2-epimerase